MGRKFSRGGLCLKPPPTQNLAPSDPLPLRKQGLAELAFHEETGHLVVRQTGWQHQRLLAIPMSGQAPQPWDLALGPKIARGRSYGCWGPWVAYLGGGGQRPPGIYLQRYAAPAASACLLVADRVQELTWTGDGSLVAIVGVSCPEGAARVLLWPKLARWLAANPEAPAAHLPAPLVLAHFSGVLRGLTASGDGNHIAWLATAKVADPVAGARVVVYSRQQDADWHWVWDSRGLSVGPTGVASGGRSPAAGLATATWGEQPFPEQSACGGLGFAMVGAQMGFFWQQTPQEPTFLVKVALPVGRVTALPLGAYDASRALAAAEPMWWDLGQGRSACLLSARGQEFLAVLREPLQPMPQASLSATAAGDNDDDPLATKNPSSARALPGLDALPCPYSHIVAVTVAARANQPQELWVMGASDQRGLGLWTTAAVPPPALPQGSEQGYRWPTRSPYHTAYVRHQVSWQTPTGLCFGLYYHPCQGQLAPVPTIMPLHGLPRGGWVYDTLQTKAAYWCRRGYGVLFANYPGSGGYGGAYRHQPLTAPELATALGCARDFLRHHGWGDGRGVLWGGASGGWLVWQVLQASQRPWDLGVMVFCDPLTLVAEGTGTLPLLPVAKEVAGPLVWLHGNFAAAPMLGERPTREPFAAAAALAAIGAQWRQAGCEFQAVGIGGLFQDFADAGEYEAYYRLLAELVATYAALG